MTLLTQPASAGIVGVCPHPIPPLLLGGSLGLQVIFLLRILCYRRDPFRALRHLSSLAPAQLPFPTLNVVPRVAFPAWHYF